MPERIESLIAKEVLAEFDRLNEKVSAGVTNFERLYASAVAANKALGGSRTFKEVIDDTEKLKKAEKELYEQQQKNIKLEQEREKVRVLAAKANDLNAAASLKSKKESEISEKQLDKERIAQEKLNMAKERKAANTPPPDDPTNANIPYTNNLDQIKAENERIEALERAEQAERDMAAASQDSGDVAKYEALKQQEAADAILKKAEAEKLAANSSKNLSSNSTAESLVRDKILLSEVTEERKKYDQQLKSGSISLTEYQSKLAPLAVREAGLKLSVAALTKELKNQAQIEFSAPGSIDIAKARVAQLSTSRNNLDITNPKDIQEIKELNVQIDQLNALIDENSDKLAQQKINIGNYPTAFKGAFNTLNGELELVSKNLQSGGFKGKELDDLAKKQSALQRATALVSQEFKSSSAQQNAFKEAAKEIGLVYGTNSQVFKSFNKDVASGSKELGKVAKDVDGAAKNTSKFGGAITSAFGKLRLLAAAIPGIGLAGLIGLLITPLVTFGAKILEVAKSATAAGRAFLELQRVQKNTNEVFEQSSQAFVTASSNVAELQENVKLAKEGFLDKDKVVKEYNDTMGKTAGSVKTLDEVEQSLVKNADAYIKFTLLKAVAQRAFDEAAKKSIEAGLSSSKGVETFVETTDVAVSALKNVFKFPLSGNGVDIAQDLVKTGEAARKKTISEARKDSDVLTGIAKKAQSDAAKLATQFKFNFFGDTDKAGKDGDKLKAVSKKFFDDELRDQAQFLKEFSVTEIAALDLRVDARNKAYGIEKKLINEQRNFELQSERDKLNAAKGDKGLGKNGLINAQNEYNQRVFEINQKANYDEKRLAQVLGNDLIKIKQSTAKRIRESDNEILNIRLKDQSSANQKIADNDKNSYDVRLAAAFDAYEAQAEIISNNLNLQLKDETLTAEKRKAIVEKANSDIANLTTEYGEKQLKLVKDNEKKITEAIEKENKARKDIISTGEANESIALNERRRHELTNDAELDRQQQDIAERARIKELGEDVRNAQAKYAVAVANTQKITGATQESVFERIAAEKDLAVATKAFSDAVTEHEIANIKRKGEKMADGAKKIQDVFNDVADVIGGALNASITSQKNAIQDQMDAIDDLTSKQIDAINMQATTATNTEQDKAAKITLINAKAQADKEKLERKQRQLDLERARFEKAQAIANIILNTAQAVSKLLYAPPLAIAAAVLGAAQLAVAIATPLPKFAKGTDDAPGGKVIVGDGGVHEYVATPSGDLYETPATATIMDVEKHSTIYPSRRAALEAGVMTRGVNEIRSLVNHGQYMREMTDRMTSRIGSKIDQLNNTIKNKSENHWHQKKDGWDRIKARGGSRSRILNNR